MTPQKRLYKTQEGKMIGGVLKGFSEYYNMDVSMVRIVYALLTVFVVGSPIIIYLILYLVLPDKSEVLQEQDPYNIENDYYD